MGAAGWLAAVLVVFLLLLLLLLLLLPHAASAMASATTDTSVKVRFVIRRCTAGGVARFDYRRRVTAQSTGRRARARRRKATKRPREKCLTRRPFTQVTASRAGTPAGRRADSRTSRLPSSTR